MIEKHILHYKPQHVVLAGPFVSEDQLKGELEQTFISHADIREQGLDMLCQFAAKRDVHVTIVQDAAEIDNFFPIPVPYTMVTSDNFKPKNVTKVGAPCLLNFDNKLRLAVSTGNFQVNTRAFPVKNEGTSRFGQIVRSFVSQRSLHSIFPGELAFDVTQSSSLVFDESTKPHVWVCPSSFTQFCLDARGVAVCNPSTIFDGQEFRSFAKVDVDCGRAMDEELTGNQHVKVEVLKF